MAKKKSRDKPKAGSKQKRANGSAAINRAEKRLVKALEKVEKARGKVTRREHELAALMEKYGRSAPTQDDDDVSTLSAVDESESDIHEDEDSSDETASEAVETPAANDSDDHHE